MPIKFMPVLNTPENQALCACVNCPSYNDEMRAKAEILYCASGKSACEFKHLGCICGGCPVHQENGLDSVYYCASGAAK